MWQIKRDEAKNKTLREIRWIWFEDVLVAINEDRILWIKKHHNQKKYPWQMVLIVNINTYAWRIPFIQQEDWSWFLKTCIPSRKETKFYNLQ